MPTSRSPWEIPIPEERPTAQPANQAHGAKGALPPDRPGDLPSDAQKTEKEEGKEKRETKRTGKQKETQKQSTARRTLKSTPLGKRTRATLKSH